MRPISTSRLCPPLLLLLPLLPLLGGCAHTGDPAAPQTSTPYAGGVSARDYGFVRPARDVVVLERGSGRGLAAKRSGAGGGDLWGRVRAGLQLTTHPEGRVDAIVAQLERDADYLKRLSGRAKPYLYLIVTEIERRGLPMELALLAHVESGFDPSATSPRNAAGIWQFMPHTGREMGLRQDDWYDARRDVVASTGAALDYLEALAERFDGDWALAMAAYNCGPGCVSRAQERNRQAGRPTDYWSLDLPSETERYVPRILATARLVADPGRHGQRLPAIPNQPQLELVRARAPLDLAQVAETSGVELGTLRRLNANLKQGRSGPSGSSQVLVPAGTGARLSGGMRSARILPAAGAIASASHRPARGVHRGSGKEIETRAHVVRPGETLNTIARRHGIDAAALAELNGMSDRDVLLPGQALQIPASATTAGADGQSRGRQTG